MARQTNVNDIPSDQRIFINTQEWGIDEAREFYFTGFEKVEKVSKAGKAYAQYLIYLIPTGKEFELELTLGLFASQAAGFKKAQVKEYQRVKITKTNTEKGEDWEISAFPDLMPDKQRPALADYPELKPYVNKDERKAEPAPNHDEEEINIDDIQF